MDLQMELRQNDNRFQCRALFNDLLPRNGARISLQDTKYEIYRLQDLYPGAELLVK